MNEIRITFKELADTLKSVLLKFDFSEERAILCAYLFAKADLDGVSSHGTNRFLDFLCMIKEG